MESRKLTYLLFRNHLYDDSGTSNEYLEIINDYMLGTAAVSKVLKMASDLREKKPDFNHYVFIVYGLISIGKRKKIERTNRK